jgi:hypothetical protein
VTLTLPAGEPAAGPWRRVTVRALLDRLLAAAGEPPGRPRIIAIDGRGASGKSTLASRLRELVPGAAVVHTDDLAWHEPRFAWGHLLADDVLGPLRSGQPLRYRPPQWEVRGREGSIEVAAGCDLVLVEGTGASHREHADLIDVTVWVQADHAEAERRGIARDIAQGVNGGPQETTAFWHAWMREELAFFAEQRPWERAALVVNGTPGGGHDPEHVEVEDASTR